MKNINWKGKEYNYKGELRFEGEYLNIERKKGFGYDYDGKLIFEGEYLNGKRWEGKGYNKYSINIIREFKGGKGLVNYIMIMENQNWRVNI